MTGLAVWAMEQKLRADQVTGAGLEVRVSCRVWTLFFARKLKHRWILHTIKVSR